MKQTAIVLSMLLCTASLCAQGLSINLPLVGRVAGSGGVLFATSVDVSNNSTTPVRVDFYFDGRDVANGELVSIAGSLGDPILVQRGGSALQPMSSAHFEDFISALVDANLLASSVRDDGVQGSVLFVFNGFSKSGQGAVTARFYNAFGGGNVGVAIGGHEIAAGEPQKLAVTALDTTGTASGAQVYPNLFINNTALAPDGTTAHGDVSVQISAVSTATHQPVGTPITLTIPAGQTATVNHVFQSLGIAPDAKTTALLVYASVTSGAAAIEGLISEVDTVTKDGSAFVMSRADF